jgi:hypothetical protein
VRWPIVIVVATITCAPATVAASPGDAPWDGAVFAGPTAPHASNVSANPAPMLLMTPGVHLFVGGVGAIDQISIDRRVVDENGVFSDGPSVDGVTAGMGGHVGIVRAWPDFALAFISSTPPPDETLAGEAALAYHTRGTRTRMVDYGALSLAYRLTGRISVGGSGTLSVRDTVMRFARDTAAEAGRDPARGTASDCGGMRCGLENPLATEEWTVTVGSDRWNEGKWFETPAATLDDLRFAVGALVTLPGDVRLGVTYQRPWNLGRIARTGDVRVVGAPRDGAGVHGGDATLFDKQPQVVRVGARSRMLARWDVVGELRWRMIGRASYEDVRTYGGDLAAGNVPAIYPRPRGLRDVYALELGMEEIDDGQVLRLGARLGADTGAVGGNRLSARAPYGRQLTAGGGAQLRFGSWVVQLTYNMAFQPAQTTEPGVFDPVRLLDCVDSGYDVNEDACATVRAGYGAPTAAGEYTRFSHVGRVSLRFEVP